MNSIIKTNGNDESPSPAQNSIWETLKTPVKVITGIITILVLISPLVSVYLIFLYLGNYVDAKVIAYNIFYNINSLAIVLIYGLVITLSIAFSIIFLPFLSGYYMETLIDKPITCSKKKDYKQKINFSEFINKKIKPFFSSLWQEYKICIILIMALAIICFFCFYPRFPNIKIISSIIIALLTIICTHKIANIINNNNDKKEKADEKADVDKYSFSNVSNSIFGIILFLDLFIVYSLTWVIFLLKNNLLSFVIQILFITFIYFVGYNFAKKPNKSINDSLFIIFFIFVFFIVINAIYLQIPFSKEVVKYTGMGNTYVRINFKSKKSLPAYIATELKNAKITINKKVFLLIQSANSYYIMQKNKKTYCIVKVPKKYAYIQVCKKNTSLNNKKSK